LKCLVQIKIPLKKYIKQGQIKVIFNFNRNILNHFLKHHKKHIYGFLINVLGNLVRKKLKFLSKDSRLILAKLYLSKFYIIK